VHTAERRNVDLINQSFKLACQRARTNNAFHENRLLVEYICIGCNGF